jgi:predicted acetyltransferase
MTPVLVEPSAQYKAAFLDYVEEWVRSGEKFVPIVVEYLRVEFANNFEAYVEGLLGFAQGRRLNGFVPHSTYWLMAENRVVGVSNLRHKLTERLLIMGGHIGYGVRPSERKKGYATLLLAETLKKARGLGIEKTLITCDKTNLGSQQVMLNNGAVLEDERLHEGKQILRFWIDLRKPAL